MQLETTDYRSTEIELNVFTSGEFHLFVGNIEVGYTGRHCIKCNVIG